MSNQKHTPEPWSYFTNHEDTLNVTICDVNGTPLSITDSIETAARIVASVNAMEGVGSPSEWRKLHTDRLKENVELKQERDELLLTIKRLSQTFLKGKTAKEITDWLRKECNQVLDKAKEASHEG